ncbi:hypothetical protein CALCODRAFT_519234 [Calocera cornea HHB12733]|uniref:Peptidase A1 domain-containing protein n=1 Tax=Calocera cornea HHB12733 TaxID=1353952 RepID=A0A165EDN9_9BASI|nr:hypothetical protein CALCODRAFT_519234 [Calocera cornea HHB12733]
MSRGAIWDWPCRFWRCPLSALLLSPPAGLASPSSGLSRTRTRTRSHCSNPLFIGHRGMAGTSLGYNISLGSQSPLFTYLPLRDAPEDSGWNASYTGTTHAQAYGGGAGVGTAYRETQVDGASIGLDFNGTAIYFCLGLSSYPSTSQLTVDGTTWSYAIDQSSDPACAAYDGADSVVVVNDIGPGPHYVELAVNLGSPDDFVRFYGAAVTLSTGAGDPLVPSTVSCRDTAWTYAPGDANWHIRPDADLLNNSQAVGDLTGFSMWGHVVDPATIASITISNTTAFYLLGPVGPKFANYTIAFNGANKTFVPGNYFAAYQQVLYFAGGLDPAEQYELQVQDWDPENSGSAGAAGSVVNVAIDALVLMQPQSSATSGQPAGASTTYPSYPTGCSTCQEGGPLPTPLLPPGEAGSGSGSSSSPNVAAIIGGIAGGLVLITVVTLLLLWSRIRRCMHRGQLDMAGEDTPLRRTRSPRAPSTRAEPYRVSRAASLRSPFNQRPAVTIRTKDLPLRPMSTASVISISPRWTEKQPPSQDSPMTTLTTSTTRGMYSPLTAASSRPDLLHTVPLSDLVSHLNERLQQPGTSAESAPPQYE